MTNDAQSMLGIILVCMLIITALSVSQGYQYSKNNVHGVRVGITYCSTFFLMLIDGAVFLALVVTTVMKAIRL